jgi:hypothetical protein
MSYCEQRTHGRAHARIACNIHFRTGFSGRSWILHETEEGFACWRKSEDRLDGCEHCAKGDVITFEGKVINSRNQVAVTAMRDNLIFSSLTRQSR